MNQRSFSRPSVCRIRTANHCQQRRQKNHQTSLAARVYSPVATSDIHVQGQHLTAQYNYSHNDDAALVMIIHGWLGSADSSYVSPLRMHCSAGYHIARLTLRDHGGTADLNEGLFHSAMTDEVVAAEFIMDDFGCSKAGLVGFSMGGNFAFVWQNTTPVAYACHLPRDQPTTYR